MIGLLGKVGRGPAGMGSASSGLVQKCKEAGLRLRLFAEQGGVMQSDMKFEGKLDAVHIRGDKQIQKRKNLGASFLERLRGKLTREGVAR